MYYIYLNSYYHHESNSSVLKKTNPSETRFQAKHSLSLLKDPETKYCRSFWPTALTKAAKDRRVRQINATSLQASEQQVLLSEPGGTQ